MNHPKTSPTLVATTLALACSAAWSQADAPQRVEINAAVDRSYQPSDASSATRLDTPLKETPVTVQVVDATLLRDKALRSPNELADLVAGVQPVVGYGNTPSQYFIVRGFSNKGVNYRNGYRLSEVYTPRDLANVERVEFVKGPASVLYGAAEPGGAVNTVTKQPGGRDFGHAHLSAGSFSAVRAELDVNRSVGDLGLRLNAAADQADSWIDLESSRNAIVAPVLRWRLSPTLSVLYEGEFQRTTRQGWSNGLLHVPGVQNLPEGTTLAEPWAGFKNTNSSHRLELQARLSDDWSFRQGFYDARSRRSMNSASPSFNSDPYPSNTVNAMARVAYSQFKDDPTNTVSQTELSGRLQVFGVDHRVLMGLEASKAVFDYMGAYNDLDVVNLAVFQPGSTPRPDDPPNFGERRSARSNALYVQDQFSLGAWRLLAGVRHERVKSRSVDTVYGGEAPAQDESATTARLGLLYLVSPATAAYYSFSQSFSPNTAAHGSNNSILKAERGTQHEAGLKHTLWPGLEGTLALFDIRKRNVAVADPDDALASVTQGEQRSRGWELSLSGRATPQLRVVANLAGQQAIVSRDPDYQGNRLLGVPRLSGNLWGVLSLGAGIEVGAGVVRVGEREAAQSPNLDYFKLPAYTRLDAALYGSLGRVKLALNVDNLSNAKIIQSLEGSAVLVEAPRRWTVSAGLDF